MPVPNPTMPVKGAGTTLWVYKGSGDPYANPLSDVDWSRLAKVKDLTPGELTAESYDDSYLDDEDADWTATGQGQKSAGDTSFTLAWMPGEQGQQALLAWFNEGDTRAYKIRFPNGTVDVFRGWVSSIGNHAAIYCGDGELLHHIPEQLSKRERYTDKWQRRTHSLWRHRAWHASAFTGICNDLAAASIFV
ncbi:phage tail tube protein [Escherichia coli]|uniref:phage tail tube protein n=1 Tax=Escherichia coli TaxID=562 RepID=UPI00374D0910